MSKGNQFLSRHERRLTSSYSNLTRLSPAATPIYRPNHLHHQDGHDGGVSEQNPLSVYGFDKSPEYIENVKNCIKTQHEEEEKERCGSPQWVPRYNSDINHTGEQPLIVQHYLSGNKQEQRNGVLPVQISIPPRLKSASHHHREERQEYHHGKGTHEYLTATEMSGQSRQPFDKSLGRPTRASLLRTHFRSRSAPGVRAPIEVSHLHKQQHMSARTENRSKSVDIPKDLQPVTDTGETVHQFIIGARYNKNVFRDANYLAASGINVSKRSQQSEQTPPHFPNGRSTDNGYLASSSYSSASTNLPNTIHLPNASHRPNSTKEAWGSETSLSKSHPVSKNTSAAPTPPPPEARLGAATQSSPRHFQQALTRSRTVIDGNALHKSHPKAMGGCQDCVMCRKGVPLKGMPATFRLKVDPAAKRTGVGGREREDKMEKYTQSVSRERNMDNQLVQQYHLKILGVKMGDEVNRPQSPRTKVHYNSAYSARCRPVSSRNQLNQNKNNSGRSTRHLIFNEVTRDNRMISIRIDTPNFADDTMTTPWDTPRDENNEKHGCLRFKTKEQPSVEPRNYFNRAQHIDNVKDDLHEVPIQDENGNHEAVTEHNIIQVDGNQEKAEESFQHPEEMRPVNKGVASNMESRIDGAVSQMGAASGISDALKNVVISSKTANINAAAY